ncbi:hypothetical protein DENIS_2874 [Desulfonema ishimotonii]|uniref:Uncharacterized protein n=1 Tax=Desulfonema ishimotonii TaxID=45657 RepID=A0A401FY28_9BACT|nr:hypothetical protein [Desulfonema ishimotonii]GBC61912.1 hypothetical protein DENIS_2874 [Desulfonema ishimotonii]
MILSPAIIALISCALLISGFAVYAALTGLHILRDWDMQSGSETQLMLERKTYLISAIFSHILIAELLSLVLFIFTADRIHDRFVGAMCAAGALNVNAFGYPGLILKTANFILCGLWLIVNHTDRQAPDYPLIRPKYRFLMAISALLVAEAFVQVRYFAGMRANVITSCCGTLFSENVPTLSGDLASLPPRPAAVLFFISVILTLCSGAHFWRTGRLATVFSRFAAWLLVFSVVCIISFISVCFYELPTHHCPFCILQAEYHYIGYPLYLSLFTGGIAGMGVGVLEQLSGPASLESVIPAIQKKLCIISIAGYAIFTAITLWPMLFSDFIFLGY